MALASGTRLGPYEIPASSEDLAGFAVTGRNGQPVLGVRNWDGADGLDVGAIILYEGLDILRAEIRGGDDE